ncbi:ABC transporter substrate-binding protein [Sporichthya polymorpha]|uniref:ABC transporter substrate-binding protein n=1 Tax=Sporichthya polymorpha TaxID=35751 RepID=UPI00037FFDF0|nr:ABC transporter substrate-binding protein [Sporichthya polymorpha]
MLKLRTRQVAAAALIGALALAAGCGNRVPHEQVAAVGNGYGPVDAQSDNAAGAPVAPGAVPGADAGAGVAPGVAVPGAGPTAAPGSSSGTGDTPAQPGSPTAPRPGAGQNPAQPGGAAGGGSKPCTTPLKPIVLGQTLATSGLVGASISGLRTGLAVWAKEVNARGGVQCHPIQLIQLDDASDPARVASNWNTLVKDRGAVAVVGAGVPIAIAALRTAAERDKVPVVGGDVVAGDWTQSPYLFPPGAAPLTANDGALVQAARNAQGAPKTGLFYCVEASICSAIKNGFQRSTELAKAALGPIQAVSLTQPDFTSECQTMKSAGVNTLFLGLDGSAIIRAVRSCASLNYFPTIATGAVGVSAAVAADPGVQRNSMYLGNGVVPFMTTDTPGIRAFHDAFARFAPSAKEEQQALLGWTAGKLFEAALAKVSDQARAGDVSTARILEGLWKLKNEKLDGLSPGATFAKGSTAKALECYYPIKLDTKGFSAPAGSKVECFGKG